jgi:hypothetical protein
MLAVLGCPGKKGRLGKRKIRIYVLLIVQNKDFF